MTGQRPVLSAIQLRRAIENAGGLWTVTELRNIGVLRHGDPRGDLPASVHIDRTNFRTGYEMQAYAEQLGRAAAAEAMADAINERLAQVAKHYTEPNKRKTVGRYERRRDNRRRVIL